MERRRRRSVARGAASVRSRLFARKREGLRTWYGTRVLRGVAIALFQWALLVLGPCLAFAAWRSAQARAIVGAVIAEERPRRALRLATLLLLHAIAAAVVLVRRDLPLANAFVVLAFGAALALLSPGFGDAIAGEDGVRRGWHARGYGELEEWRLTGDHLRFRLFGEWTAVPLPPAAQTRVREKLVALVPDRESPFKD